MFEAKNETKILIINDVNRYFDSKVSFIVEELKKKTKIKFYTK